LRLVDCRRIGILHDEPRAVGTSDIDYQTQQDRFGGTEHAGRRLLGDTTPVGRAIFARADRPRCETILLRLISMSLVPKTALLIVAGCQFDGIDKAQAVWHRELVGANGAVTPPEGLAPLDESVLRVASGPVVPVVIDGENVPSACA